VRSGRDAARGKSLSEGVLGCASCHVLTAVGPKWPADAGAPGIGSRAETRFQAPGYAGQATSAEQYLFESVVMSNAYVVEGFQSNLMPQNYADRLTQGWRICCLHAQPTLARVETRFE
jgi:hypothetical protein